MLVNIVNHMNVIHIRNNNTLLYNDISSNTLNSVNLVNIIIKDMNVFYFIILLIVYSNNNNIRNEKNTCNNMHISISKVITNNIPDWYLLVIYISVKAIPILNIALLSIIILMFITMFVSNNNNVNTNNNNNNSTMIVNVIFGDMLIILTVSGCIYNVMYVSVPINMNDISINSSINVNNGSSINANNSNISSYDNTSNTI